MMNACKTGDEFHRMFNCVVEEIMFKRIVLLHKKYFKIKRTSRHDYPNLKLQSVVISILTHDFKQLTI